MRRKALLALVLVVCALYLAPPLHAADEPPNVILISFDGYQRNHLHEQLEAGELPNLRRLIDMGVYLELNQMDYKTQTKTAHAQMLSGYQAKYTGVYANLVLFHPLPAGYTLLERVEERFGPESVVTGFISGKTSNIAPVFVEMAGVDYVSIVDEYLEDVGGGTGEKFLGFIDDHHDEHFVAFFHTKEPDKLGHLHGENSPEYDEGGIRCDRYLGLILDKLAEHGIIDNTLLYVCTDHGFKEDGYDHPHEPLIWLVTNDLRLNVNAAESRLFLPDIACTILWSLGVEVSEPPLCGYPLQLPLPPDAERRMTVWGDSEPPELSVDYSGDPLELPMGGCLNLSWTVKDDQGLGKTYLVLKRVGVVYGGDALGEVLFMSNDIDGLEAEFSYSLRLPFSEALFEVTVYAFDERENLASRSITVGVDTTPPRITIDRVDDRPVRDATLLSFFVSDEAGLRDAELLIDGETLHSYHYLGSRFEQIQYCLDVSDIPNGVHQIGLRASDIQGNVSEVAASITVKNLNPVTKILMQVLAFIERTYYTPLLR